MSYAGSSISSSSRRTYGDALHSSRQVQGILSSGLRSYSSTRLGGERSGYSGLVHGYSMPALNYIDSLDLSRSSTLTGDAMRVNEKQLLQDLNERFSSYIAKVHDLEQHNKDLDDEISGLKQRQADTTRSGNNDVYELELKELRDLIEHINGEKISVQLEQEHLEEEIKKLGEKCSQDVRLRNEADELVKMFSKNTEAVSLVQMSNEKKIEALLDEIVFLRKNHEEEVEQLLAQMKSASVSVEKTDYEEPGIAAALREIRGKFQLKGQVEGAAEQHFQTKFKQLTDAAVQNDEAMRVTKEELSKYRHELSQRSTELNTLLGTRDSLERQLSEMEERHQFDMGNLQDVMEQLQGELRDSKCAMARRLCEYQDLLNAKMALDIEISAYKRLLDGEEAHLSSNLMLGPARPIYTYTPKAKPQDESLKDLNTNLEEIASEGLAKACPSDTAEQAKPLHGEEDDSNKEDAKDEDAKEEVTETPDDTQTDDIESETDKAVTEGSKYADEAEAEEKADENTADLSEEQGDEEDIKDGKIEKTKPKAEDNKEDENEDLEGPKVEPKIKEGKLLSTDKRKEQEPETEDEAPKHKTEEPAEEAKDKAEEQAEQVVNEVESTEGERKVKAGEANEEDAMKPPKTDKPAKLEKSIESKDEVKASKPEFEAGKVEQPTLSPNDETKPELALKKYEDVKVSKKDITPAKAEGRKTEIPGKPEHTDEVVPPKMVDLNKNTESKRNIRILAFNVQPSVSATKKRVTKEEAMTITQQGTASDKKADETFHSIKTVQHNQGLAATVVQKEVKVQKITSSEMVMEEYEEIIEETVVSTTRK